MTWLRKVKNVDRKFGSDPHYWHLAIHMQDTKTGATEEKHFLFTDEQLAAASERADKNPEDYLSLDPEKGKWTDILKELVGG